MFYTHKTSHKIKSQFSTQKPQKNYQKNRYNDYNYTMGGKDLDKANGVFATTSLKCLSNIDFLHVSS